MNRMKNRIISVVLAISLVVTMLPMNTFASGSDEHCSWCGHLDCNGDECCHVCDDFYCDWNCDSEEERCPLCSEFRCDQNCGYVGFSNQDITNAQLAEMVANGTISLTVEKLNLRGNRISNLAPLAGLTNLTALRLHDNLISDLTPLARLTSLESLYLDSNRISNVAPLANLTNLVRLGIPRNEISDLTPLSGLVGLRELYLWDNQISNLSPLSSLSTLTHLSLYGNQISDLAPLLGLTDLRDLSLSDNNLVEDAETLRHIGVLQGIVAQNGGWIRHEIQFCKQCRHFDCGGYDCCRICSDYYCEGEDCCHRCYHSACNKFECCSSCRSFYCNGSWCLGENCPMCGDFFCWQDCEELCLDCWEYECEGNCEVIGGCSWCGHPDCNGDECCLVCDDYECEGNCPCWTCKSFDCDEVDCHCYYCGDVRSLKGGCCERGRCWDCGEYIGYFGVCDNGECYHIDCNVCDDYGCCACNSKISHNFRGTARCGRDTCRDCGIIFTCGECSDCTSATDCNDCLNCSDCGHLGGRFGFGRVRGEGERPQVQDALQILRCLVRLSSVFDVGQPNRAYALAAANITRAGTSVERPQVQDALQILRFIVRLPTQGNWCARYRLQ